MNLSEKLKNGQAECWTFAAKANGRPGTSHRRKTGLSIFSRKDYPGRGESAGCGALQKRLPQHDCLQSAGAGRASQRPQCYGRFDAWLEAGISQLTEQPVKA